MVSSRELALAREAVAAVLDRLGLAAYLFEVEPLAGDGWRLRLECAVGEPREGWERVELSLPPEAFGRGGAPGEPPAGAGAAPPPGPGAGRAGQDGGDGLLERLLRPHLEACRRRVGPSARGSRGEGAPRRPREAQGRAEGAG